MLSQTALSKVNWKQNLKRSAVGRVVSVAAIALLASITGGAADAQIITQDWSITEPDLSDLRWGAQEISVRVRNNSGKYKFFVAKSETRSPLRRFSEVRTFKSNYIFVPDEEKEISFVVDAPENLSYVTVKIGFYDVVDTLDDVKLGKEIYLDTFKVTPPAPPGLAQYSSFTPRAGSILKYNTSLKTDLALLIHTMLQEPLSVEELTKRLDLPFAVVSRTIRNMEEHGFVRQESENLYRTTLTTIEGLPAASIRGLMDRNASRMAETLEQALQRFILKRQQMMDSGLVTRGTRETLEGTGMLHHLFPLVGGITLWENVGSQFIIGGEGPPQIIDLDAPCDMVTEGYGYVLMDTSLSDGDEFFYYDPNLKRRVFGDHVPAVLCARRAPSAKVRPSYYLPSKKTTLMYYYDKERVADAVDLLSYPLIPIRDKFSAEVESLFEKSNVQLMPAHRFWLWNRLVTSVMQKLVNDGVLEDRRREFFTWRERLEDAQTSK